MRRGGGWATIITSKRASKLKIHRREIYQGGYKPYKNRQSGTPVTTIELEGIRRRQGRIEEEEEGEEG